MKTDETHYTSYPFKSDCGSSPT